MTLAAPYIWTPRRSVLTPAWEWLANLSSAVRTRKTNSARRARCANSAREMRKPSCCGCGCSHCTGAQATCLTGVLSGVVANPCGYTQTNQACGSTRTTGISGWNRTVTMNCPAGLVDIFPCTGSLGGIGNYSVNPSFASGCGWWTLDGPVVYDAGCEGDYYTYITTQARYAVRNYGSGLVGAAVWIPAIEPPFGTSRPDATLFIGTATTTTENACTFATPITFTNLITNACLVGCDDDYGYPIGLPAWVDGTFTVGAC